MPWLTCLFRAKIQSTEHTRKRITHSHICLSRADSFSACARERTAAFKASAESASASGASGGGGGSQRPSPRYAERDEHSSATSALPPADVAAYVPPPSAQLPPLRGGPFLPPGEGSGDNGDNEDGECTSGLLLPPPPAGAPRAVLQPPPAAAKPQAKPPKQARVAREAAAVLVSGGALAKAAAGGAALLLLRLLRGSGGGGARVAPRASVAARRAGAGTGAEGVIIWQRCSAREARLRTRAPAR